MKWQKAVKKCPQSLDEKIAMNQESYSCMREEKEKDIIKHEKSQKDISTKYIFWKKLWIYGIQKEMI